MTLGATKQIRRQTHTHTHKLIHRLAAFRYITVRCRISWIHVLNSATYYTVLYIQYIYVYMQFKKRNNQLKWMQNAFTLALPV